MKLTGRTTLKTLAKASGVSVATASQVIRGVGRISEHTRKRVLSTAEKMNYIPDGRAISMRSGERPEIGMIIQELANPFNAEVVSGVSDYLERHGYFVSVLDSRNDIERQKRNIEAFIRSARGGLIWVPAHNAPQKTVELLRNHSIPTITFLRQIKGTDFDHIGIKNTEARWNTLLASVNSISPGDILELKIIRSNSEVNLDLVTKERPNRPQAL